MSTILYINAEWQSMARTLTCSDQPSCWWSHYPKVPVPFCSYQTNCQKANTQWIVPLILQATSHICWLTWFNASEGGCISGLLDFHMVWVQGSGESICLAFPIMNFAFPIMNFAYGVQSVSSLLQLYNYYPSHSLH